MGDYFVEVTEFNDLKCKILNKVETYKPPQFDEVAIIKNVDCGDDHTLLLDSEGNVWAFGLNLNGQLGMGHLKAVERPMKIKGFGRNRIVLTKTEGDINFALDDRGEAYMWPMVDKQGHLLCEPLPMPVSGEKIKSIACGSNFAIFLTQQGLLYSMGKSNKYGQLGHGDQLTRHKPTLIEFFQLNCERVTQISCGYKHCAARSATGKVYTWGLVNYSNFRDVKGNSVMGAIITFHYLIRLSSIPSN
jgi:hypothetical protein